MSKTIRHVVLSALLGLLLALCGLIATQNAWADEAGFPQNENLTQEEIQQRFHKINESYAVGEALNDADADFVLHYGQSCIPFSEEIAPPLKASSNFSISGSYCGTSVTASGTLYHDGFLNYTWGGNVNVRKTSGPTPQSMRLILRCTAYGPKASTDLNEIFKLYEEDISYTGYNKDAYSASPSRSYSGYTLMYRIDAFVDVTTASGSFFTVSA